MRDSDWNPYRRFTITLASSMILFGLLLSASVIYLVNSYVVRETVELTKNAVIVHFAKLPQLNNIYNIQPEQSSSYGDNVEYGYDTGSYDGAYTHDPSMHQDDSDYQALLGLVRMHFDLYNVVETNFYYSDGSNAFSYDQDKIGLSASESDQLQINAAAGQKKAISRRLNGRLLHLWIPIPDTGGNISGVVEMKRDISLQIKQARLGQIGLISAIFIAILILFFAMRHTFINSTRMIDDKNRKLNELLKAIERTYDESLTTLSGALDSRDNETLGHSYRVTAYAQRLGRELELTETELKDLARGALLHDVGKIGVPDSILRKPGGLTAEEWVIMRKHVHIGYQMLKHIDFLHPALDIVQYHHERWDGKGYPYGLSGEQIPLPASIFSVCDAYDAITSDRTYRAGRSYEDAKMEIICCCGSQFHPLVVEAFLRVPESEWTAIQEQAISKKD